MIDDDRGGGTLLHHEDRCDPCDCDQCLVEQDHSLLKRECRMTHLQMKLGRSKRKERKRKVDVTWKHDGSDAQT